MSTVGEVVKMMNEVHLHPQGFHLFFVSEKLIAEDLGDTPHHILSQTYDWRYGKPDKEEYTIKLTAADVEYLGKALEVYDEAIFTRYLKPEIECLMEKLGGGE